MKTGLPPAKRVIEGYRRSQHLAGRVAESVRARQSEIYATEAAKTEIAKYASDAINIAHDLVAQVSQVYRVPPRRRIRGGTPEQQAAFARIVDDSGIHTLAREWARQALYSGVVVVAPILIRGDTGRVVPLLRTYLSHECEFSLSAMGAGMYPLAVQVSRWGDVSRGDVRASMSMDGNAWTPMDGADVGEPVVHGLPLAPYAIFRMSPAELDLYGLAPGRRADAATVEAGVQWAELSFVRKTQRSKQLVYLDASRGSTAPQQVQHPELPLELGEGADLKSLDLTVSPKDFLDHIDYIAKSAYLSYGVTSADFRGASDRVVTLSHQRLQSLREEQAAWFAPAESRLWTIILGMVARSDHPAADLFDPELIYEVDVDFPGLPPTEDPQVRESLYLSQVARGASDPVSSYLEDHPALTREEAEAEVAEHRRLAAAYGVPKNV